MLEARIMRALRKTRLVPAMIAALCFSCAGAPTTTSDDTAEAPPPSVEIGLDPRAGLVDPRADELVRRMSEALANASSFTLEAEEVYDELPEQSPRIQLAARRHLSLRRPDRLAGGASGDALNASF